MGWVHITGVIHLDYHSDITRGELLNYYKLYSHHLVGSEGGLEITFTRGIQKLSFDSTGDEFYANDYSPIRNMIIAGSLRDVDSEREEVMVDALEAILERMNKDRIVRNASFLVECSNEVKHYSISSISGNVGIHEFSN